MYDIDTPLAILTLVAITPVRFEKSLSLDHSPDAGARMIALSMLTYVASYYVLAALSKLAFTLDWPFSVRLGNLYYISYLWFGQQMPPLLDWSARRFSEFFRAFPWLDTLVAAFILLEQAMWAFVLFSRNARLQVGLITAVSHVVIAITSGIVFLTWPFIAIAVTIPFSVARLKAPMSSAPLPVKALVVPALAIILAVSPAIGTVILPPFYNYYSFGWVYPDVSKISDVYALGYRDADTRKLHSVPMLQGGFFEYRFGVLLSVNVRYYLTSAKGSPDEAEASRRLLLMMSAVREPNSNQWLLGPLTAPAHLIGDYKVIDMRHIKKFELLKGKPEINKEGGPALAKWQTCGAVQDGIIERYDQCLQ
jgi:hypothetical protein